MLALLEGYKNSIGGMQHAWMVFLCRKLGLTEYVLPRSISKLEFVGAKSIFKDGWSQRKVVMSIAEEVDPFWWELSSRANFRPKDIEIFIMSNIPHTVSSGPIYMDGESKQNGEVVLSAKEKHILLPEEVFSTKTLANDKKYMLPTKIGRFRL